MVTMLKRIPVKYLIIAGVGISVVLVGLIIALVIGSEPEPPRYNLETSGKEPNFEGAVFHTAEDGIAVVGGSASIPDEAEASLPPTTTLLTASPESIWEGAAEPDTPVGNFTATSALADSENRLGVLSIPVIGVEAGVYESGDDMLDMSHGIAHFPHSSVWDGNVCLSAHNINFDGSQGYFYAIHSLKPGDEITYSTSAGERAYSVSEVTEKSWEDWFADEFNRYRGLGASVRVEAVEETNADTVGEFRLELVALVNEERDKAGLPAYTVSDECMDYSQVRAEELVTLFSHTRPDGSDAGYEVCTMVGTTPAEAVQAWMNSPPHRAAVLNETRTYVGSGTFITSGGACYWQMYFERDPDVYANTMIFG